MIGILNKPNLDLKIFDARGTSKRDVWRVSRKVSDESLGRDETYVCKASHMIMHCEILIFYIYYDNLTL